MSDETNRQLTLQDIPMGETYFVIRMGEVHECQKVDERYGRKTKARGGKVTSWPDPRVFLAAADASRYLENLFERGRKIRQEAEESEL